VYLCYWLRSLREMTDALRRSDPASYEWWYLEQGDPAMSFHRAGEHVTIRAIEDEGRGDNESYFCELRELVNAVEDVLEDVRRTVIREAGERGARWFALAIVPGQAPNPPMQRTGRRGILWFLRWLWAGR
jgi:hypothetical protein